MSTISIEGMEFFAYHGCFDEEQLIGTKFLVDLYFEADTQEAELSDDLSKTINYQTVFLLVKEEMQQKSKLLEHVGRRILNRLKSEYPTIESATLKISKLNPPLGGKMENVSVTLDL